MHFRMQRLNPTLHHFWRTCVFRDFSHFVPSRTDERIGPAGRNERHTPSGERGKQIFQTRLIGNTN